MGEESSNYDEYKTYHKSHWNYDDKHELYRLTSYKVMFEWTLL